MLGPQFLHLMTVSRRSNRAGQCVDQILGEVERIPTYSAHVAEPTLPELVAGMPLPELRAAHDLMVAGASTTVRIGDQVRHRAIRRDRRTLLAAIASYPLTWHQIGHYPLMLIRLAEWETATVAWARATFGGAFATAVRHRDEERPHLHLYALPLGLEGVDANLLHPGMLARQETLKRLKTDGVSARDATRAANIAYREAMREVQDDYHRAVGEPCGLTRRGPNRRRLPRSAWQMEKRDAVLRAERLAAIETREAHVEARSHAQDMRDHEQDALDRVQEARTAALGLAVSLVAEGRLRLVQGRIQAPPEHHQDLLLVWPEIGPAIRQLVALRGRWNGGLLQVRDLLRHDDMPADLRNEAAQLLKEQCSRHP